VRSLTPSPGPPRPARGLRIGPARGLRPPPHPHRTPAAPPPPAAAGPGRSAAGRGPRARGCGSRHAGRGAAGPAAATAELRGTAAANGAPGRAPEPPTRPHSGRRRPMGRRGGLRPQPIAGGVREPTVGGRRGVAAEGALRQGGGAHARTPLAPPREANLCAALRQSALPAPRRIFLRGPTRRLKTAPRRAASCSAFVHRRPTAEAAQSPAHLTARHSLTALGVQQSVTRAAQSASLPHHCSLRLPRERGAAPPGSPPPSALPEASVR